MNNDAHGLYLKLHFYFSQRLDRDVTHICFTQIYIYTCIDSDMNAATFPKVPKLMISWTSLAYFSPSEPKIPL